MSAVYMSRNKSPNDRLLDCPTAAVFFAHCRINCNLHWRYDDTCYQTHRWTSDARLVDGRHWPADTALSSLLRAVREDDRLAGDPVVRLLALYITIEYLTNLL